MTSTEIRNAGVSGMSLYVPALRVPLERWCEWTGNPWDKIQAVVGRSFRYPAPNENVYTMAANAVLRLIQHYQIDPQSVGFLGLGTESSTDNAAGAVIVRGMVDRALEQLGLPRLSRNLEVPEFKHACLGGVYALKGALRYVSCDGRASRRSWCAATSPSTSAAAPASRPRARAPSRCWSRRSPSCSRSICDHAGSASDYRGPDFRKPFARHFVSGYAERVARMHDFPVFSGKYSTFSYLDETVHAVDDMLRQLGTSGREFVRQRAGVFFHRPYQLMPVQAMAFLYVRALAGSRTGRTGARGAVQRGRCVGRRARRRMPHQAGPLRPASAKRRQRQVRRPVRAVSAHGAVGRVPAQDARFPGAARDQDEPRLGLGHGPRQPVHGGAARVDRGRFRGGARGRSSSSPASRWSRSATAAAMPPRRFRSRVAPGWKGPASKIGFREALSRAIDLDREQYEALHDGHELPGVAYEPREFMIARVGETHEPAFQDLGVEYYEYVP